MWKSKIANQGVLKGDMSKWGFKVNQSFRYGVPGQVVAKHVATERKQETEIVIITVRASAQMINRKLELAMTAIVSFSLKTIWLLQLNRFKVLQNSHRGVPGQVVVRRVATAKKQEAETVIFIVRTLIQTINPTLEPVMRVTVSCVKINENIVCLKNRRKILKINIRPARILRMGYLVNL